MKRTLTLVLILSVLLSLLTSSHASAEEKVVLTIGDVASRSSNRYNADLGMWQ